MLARLGLCAVLGWILCAAPAALAGWSRPARLAGCARALSTAPPLIVFPDSAPQSRSGPGALLWTGLSECGKSSTGDGTGGTEAARRADEDRERGGGDAADKSTAVVVPTSSTSAFGAPLGTGGLPGAGRALGAAADGLAQVAAAIGTTAGQVAVAGASSADAAAGAFVEGKAAGAFPAAQPLGGPAAPIAAFSGYLGDAVIATTVHARHGWELVVRSQRHYSGSFAAPRLVPVGSLRPSALAVTMDYRSEVLAVWASGDELYARELPDGRAAGPVQKLGEGGAQPELQALLSDDGRAIVAWRDQLPSARRARGTAPKRAAPGTAAATSIYVDISSATLHFGAPVVVERFRDLRGLAPASGSLHLARMSSEAVMMAWTGVRAGRYAVRASPVSLRRGVWAPVTVSGPSAAAAGAPSDTARHAPAADAMLADLVPGPRAEVLALWTTAPRLPSGASNPARRAIEAAWGHYGGHGEALFAPPEAVAVAGPNGTPAAAFDPHSDTALAAWTTGVQTPRIDYAQRTAGPPAVTSAAAARAVRLRPLATIARASAPARSPTPRPARRDDGHAARDVALPALGLLLLAAAAAWRQLSGRRGGPPGGRGPARWHGRTRVPRG
jgi:hypothetical protein